MKYRLSKKIIVFLIILLLILILHLSGITKYFTFEKFINNREHLLAYVNEHYWLSIFVYFGIYVLAVISSLPICGLLTAFGGFLFKTIPATILSVVAGTVGSTLAFLMFRYFFGKLVQEKYSTKLVKFNNNIELYGASYLLIIQLIGLVPFFVINTLAALTKIQLHTFVWTTAVGIIPINFIYAYAGQQLGSINSLREIFSPNVLIAFACFGLLGLISFLVKWWQNNRNKKQ